MNTTYRNSVISIALGLAAIAIAVYDLTPITSVAAILGAAAIVVSAVNVRNERKMQEKYGGASD